MAAVSIPCLNCKDKHHDHYECSECGLYLGGVCLNRCGKNDTKPVKFCPSCGTSLKVLVEKECECGYANCGRD